MSRRRSSAPYEARPWAIMLKMEDKIMIIQGYEICAKADLRGADLLPATFSWDDLVGTNIDWRGAYECLPFWIG